MAADERVAPRHGSQRPHVDTAVHWKHGEQQPHRNQSAPVGSASPRDTRRKLVGLPHTHTHTRLTALCPGLPGSAGTRKVKPTWILLKQETVSGSCISWAICKSAPRSRQITTPAPHHSIFTDRMHFLPPNQQRQSTEGTWYMPTNNRQYRGWVGDCYYVIGDVTVGRISFCLRTFGIIREDEMCLV